MLKPRKKITRKELKRDPLMETLYRMRQWWLGHKKQVYRYGGIGLIVVAVVVSIVLSQAKLDKDAEVVAGKAFVEFGHGNYYTVIAQLSPHVEEYSGLKSFGNGLYLLARSQLFTGDSTGAEEHYRLYLDDYGKDPLLKSGSLAGLGIIAEGRMNYLEAAEFFKQACRAAPTASLQQQYSVYSGRNFILSHEPDPALELLRPMLEKNDLDFQTRNEVQELVAYAEAINRGR